MKVTEIAFSSYPVTDMKRARQFYEGVLRLKVSRTFGSETKGFLEYDIGSGTLAIGNGADVIKPSAGGGVIALEVDDFNAAIKQLKQFGSPFVVEPIELPVCHIAVISDPDGNSLLIHKRKAG